MNNVSKLSPIQSIYPWREKKIKSMTQYHHVYLFVFVFTLVLCWSPLKLGAYFSPWIALTWYILSTKSTRSLVRLILLFVLWVVFTLPHLLFVPNFAYSSALLTLLTYGSFLFILSTPTKPLAGKQLQRKIERIVRWFVLVQGIIGIVQAIYGFSINRTFDVDNGDYVEGTIHLALTAERTFSNPMFAVNMAMLLLYLFPFVLIYRKDRFIFAIGLVSLILASVLHVLLFFAVAAVLAFIFYAPKILLYRRTHFFVATMLLISAISIYVLQHNVSTISSFVKTTLNGNTPRAQIVLRTMSDMPVEYPLMPVIGLGPGQFSSRAGLIGTGMYFGSPNNPKPLPLLSPSMSKPFHDYLLDLWLSLQLSNSVNKTSTTYKPFFSWLSLFSEGGAVVFIIMLISVWRVLAYARKGDKDKKFQYYLNRLAFGTGVIFIFLLGMQENYWEIPQAIFVGLLILKLQYANIRYGASHSL